MEIFLKEITNQSITRPVWLRCLIYLWEDQAVPNPAAGTSVDVFIHHGNRCPGRRGDVASDGQKRGLQTPEAALHRPAADRGPLAAGTESVPQAELQRPAACSNRRCCHRCTAQTTVIPRFPMLEQPRASPPPEAFKDTTM